MLHLNLAFEKVLDESIQGVIHSILVMIDGGDELSDIFSIDIINENTKSH